MRLLGREPWRIWSIALQTVGVLGCSSAFLWSLGLISYYSFTRPYGPLPQRGWTFPLHWTHGFYGTFEENQQLLRSHDWFLPFFLMAAAGVAIRQLYVKKEPWRQKQF